MNRIFLSHARRWFILAAFLIGARSIVAQTWIQWTSAAGGNGHYYALTAVATNWEAAERIAVSWGGTLVVITSSNEQNFINDTFLTNALEHRPVWMGLVCPPKRGPLTLKLGPVQVKIGHDPAIAKADYHWATGEAVNYDNWHANQPDNFPPGENYGVMNWFYSDTPPRGVKGDWNDAPLNGTTGFSTSTDGPYFGLVERDFDPRLPVPARRISKSTIHLALLAGLIIASLIYLAFFRRRKKTVA